MNAIRIPVKVQSTTLELPQLEQFKGQVVVITVQPVPSPARSEQDLQDLAEAIGPVGYDEGLLEQIRNASMMPRRSWADQDDLASEPKKESQKT